MTAAAPLPQSEKVVFGQTFEGLFRGLGTLEPELIDGVRALGLKPGGPFLPAYPALKYREFMELVARVRYPAMPELDAYTEIGRDFIRGFHTTIVGRAVAAFAPLIGPRRPLDRLTRNFRTANNFAEVKVTEQTSGEFEVWFNEVSKPGFYRGILLEALEGTGAKDVHVDWVRSEGDAGIFRVRWSA